MIIVRDYNQGWYAKIQYGKDENFNMYVEVDGDNMDIENPHRVKTNQEALQVLEEISKIKYASDIDEHWNMSDDHRYWNRMNDLNREARNKEDVLLRKLK